MQTFSSRQYLKIDVANNFGLDKLDWDQRLEWFDSNEHQLLAKLSEAENPAMFYAGIKAWEDAKAGRAIGYPVTLDATSSGIQILSVLTGDRQAALLSNVIDSGHRVDAYQVLYERMMGQVKEEGTQFLRSDLKRAFMTAFYGSQRVPKEVFGEGKMLQAFFRTLEEETPFIWELNKFFLGIWNPEALEYRWTLPDNFHVVDKIQGKVEETVTCMGSTVIVERYENRPQPTGRSIGANVTHSIDGLIVRELVRRCSYDPTRIETIRRLLDRRLSNPGSVDENHLMVQTLWDLYQQSGYLSARILDHLDEGTMYLVDRDAIRQLLDSLPQKPFDVISIHDCFRVHPNYGNDLRRQYNLQLHLLAKSDMLSFILGQLLGKEIPVCKQDDFADEILETNYALS